MRTTAVSPRAALAAAAMVLAAVLLSSSATAQIGGDPGAFSRLGFGARGMAMGNAMAAVAAGDVVSYYNPALTPSAQYRSASASFGILSLDRSLNYVSFTLPLPPKAGISVGLINAGVRNIDGRDSDGRQTGALRTSENQVFLGFGLRPSERLQLGIGLKLLYYHLYTDITSTTIGIDAGALYRAGGGVTLALTLRDINSRYKWDTSTLFGQSGQTTEDKFPLLVTGAVSYMLPDSIGLVAVEIERAGSSTFIARAGAEVPLVPEFTLRAGIDRMDLGESGNGVRPSFGFAARMPLGSWTPAIHYAIVLEPFAPSPLHMISLAAAF
jgi:hypothetical protein